MSRFLDTNIAVYLISDNPKKNRSADILQERRNVVSVQVLNEFVSVALRKYKLDWAGIKLTLAYLRRQCEIVPLTLEVHARAVEIAERYRYHIYDACIIAAAQDAGAEILYSEDLQAGRRFGALEIVNPYD